jgi:hypothetical protein
VRVIPITIQLTYNRRNNNIGDGVCSAPACYGSSLGSNPDIYQKYKIGDISKGVANALKPAQKNIYQKLSRIIISSRKNVIM